MNRQKRTIGIVFVFLLLLIVPPFWISYREYRQARLDHALIEAIKAGDDKKALEALAEGASGEARDTGKPSTLREALLHLLDHIRQPGKKEKKDETAHTPALLLDLDKQYVIEYGGNVIAPNVALALTKAFNTPNHQEPKPNLDFALVRALLDHGARVNDQDRNGCSSLWYAVQHHNDAIANMLMAHGADVEAGYKDGWTPICTPLMIADAGVTKALIEHRANTEVRDRDQDTPLIYALRCQLWDKARILVEQGANLEARDKDQKTPLIHAIMHGQSDIVRLILEHGANVSAKDAMGRTALHYALDYARHTNNSDAPKNIALLRKYGAK